MPDCHDIDALVERHLQLIERYCLAASLGDKERCAAMMQECLIALWRNIHSLRPEASERQERAWVVWQCRGAVSHYRRSTWRWRPLNEAPLEALVAHDDTVYNELVEELDSRLDAHEKQLFPLLLENYSNNEIAEELGISYENAKTRRRRLLAKLRQYYKQIINS